MIKSVNICIMNKIEVLKKVIVISPYNTPNIELKKRRLHTLSVYCCDLLAKNIVPVSALLSGLAFSEHCKLPMNRQFWIKFNKTYIKGCDEMHVLQLPNYLDSISVKTAEAEAFDLGMKILYIPCKLL